MEETNLKLDTNLGFFSDTMNRIILREYPHRIKDFLESFSSNQYASKIWLCEELKKVLNDKKNHFTAKKIIILGSWYGTVIIPLIINNFSDVEEIQLIDMDEDALAISRKFLQHYRSDIKLSWSCEDINFIEFEDKYTNVCINTSCEHMFPMESVSFQNDHDVIYVLQSNDMDEIREHVNCVKNSKELEQQAGIDISYYYGKRNYKRAGGEKSYKRFMVIGKR